MTESLPASPAAEVSAPRTDIPAPVRSVTLRVVVLCLLLAAMLGYLMPVIDYKLYNTFLGATHLPPGAVGVLLILLLVINPLLRLVSKKWAFTREESLTVYISCLFSSLVPGHGAETFVIPNLLTPFYYATRENKWLDWLQPYLKPWLTPALNADHSINTEVVNRWYNGLPPGAEIPWGAWLVPLAVWMSMVLVSYGMMACLTIILRRQWAQNEALAFPLLRLPLEMVDTPTGSGRGVNTVSFWHNSLMWTGFGVAFFIQLIRGLNTYFPDVPTFPLSLDLGPYLSEAPWNQIDGVHFQVFPIAIGITYLLSSEVALSLWTGYWFIKLQYMAAYYLGYQTGALPGSGFSYGKAFVFFQVQGAYWMYVGLLMWTAREHLKAVFRRAIGRTKADEEESHEMLSYPRAFWGFVGCFAILTGFACAAGVRLDIALALWVCYVVFAIALTRVAVEGGLLFLLHDSAPLGALARLLPGGGAGWLSLEHGLMPASLIQSGFIIHMRGFILPSFFHAFKLAHDQKIAPRRLGWLLASVIFVSVMVSWTTSVRLGYENGALSLANQGWVTHLPKWPVNFVSTMTGEPKTSSVFNIFWFTSGAALTFGMMAARARLSWFPFHPAGYLMSLTWPGQALWASIFIAWAIKSLILRYGGPDTYRKATPFFLGLALGDVASMLLWLAIDGWQGHAQHTLVPN
ncbi:hypothetical protein B1R32_11660 [Abditibacterium utsteinense]|uniref:Uncharacterized protein n=1 Tax=Abditibacterium utsteinense TaxID=1960156 RepID=A0A2S8SQK8_9BACT|nr:DUF6785 family protein [Abditibacterium utsteinense]PQV63083.1 hypothetical protein B1R32_11660 [Abditibacterium utsteinense]